MVKKVTHSYIIKFWDIPKSFIFNKPSTGSPSLPPKTHRHSGRKAMSQSSQSIKTVSTGRYAARTTSSTGTGRWMPRSLGWVARFPYHGAM